MATHDQPLDGVRVLDLSRFPPGQYCTSLLADLGANVVCVERPGWQRMFAGIGVGLSRNKRSVALDLRADDATAVLRRLVAATDVVVENHMPGELESRGFGFPQAAEDDASVIWCSITGFGQDGPYAQWPGHDITYLAHSGVLAALGPELPWHPQIVLAIPFGASMAATAIVSTLFERARTGMGGQIDISLAEAATWILSGSDGELNGYPFGIPVGPERRLYECSDGRHVSVAASERRIWQALTTGLGLDDLSEQPPGGEDRDAAERRIAEVFSTRTAAEWVAALGPARAGISAVNRGTDLVDDPHVKARRSLHDLDDTWVPANPIRRRDPDGPRTPPPARSPVAVGADTRDVLAEASFTDDEIDRLITGGVVALASEEA